MKIEEVIKQLESIADHTERMLGGDPDADEIWEKDIDALKFTITALRSMLEAGESLTMQQLRKVSHEKIKDSTLQNIANRANEIASPPAHIDRSEWISVKNKKLLPKIKERVLSRLWYPDIGEVVVENQYYGNGIWMGETDAITHWMPLPEPPEEE